jgi:hypothetical protein
VVDVVRLKVVSSLVCPSARSCYTMGPIRSVFKLTTSCSPTEGIHMVDFEATCRCQRTGFRQEIDSAQRKRASCHVLVSLTEVFGQMWLLPLISLMQIDCIKL